MPTDLTRQLACRPTCKLGTCTHSNPQKTAENCLHVQVGHASACKLAYVVDIAAKNLLACLHAPIGAMLLACKPHRRLANAQPK